MKLPNVIITNDMTEREKQAAIEEGVLIELSTMTQTVGWELLLAGVEQKIDQLVNDLTSTKQTLDAREEDRKRGQIAAYRDVLTTVEQAEARADRVRTQAANEKERAHERAAAQRDPGYGDLPGF